MASPFSPCKLHGREDILAVHFPLPFAVVRSLNGAVTILDSSTLIRFTTIFELTLRSVDGICTISFALEGGRHIVEGRKGISLTSSKSSIGDASQLLASPRARQ